MKVLVFGACGMVGAEVLHQTLADERFEKVFSVGRWVVDEKSPKLQQIVHDDFMNYHDLKEYLVESDILPVYI